MLFELFLYELTLAILTFDILCTLKANINSFSYFFSIITQCAASHTIINKYSRNETETKPNKVPEVL